MLAAATAGLIASSGYAAMAARPAVQVGASELNQGGGVVRRGLMHGQTLSIPLSIGFRSPTLCGPKPRGKFGDRKGRPVWAD